MPKIRTLTPEFWDDPDVVKLSRDERLLLIGMITLLADDEGRLLAEAGYLKKRIFGYDGDVSVDQVRVWRDGICHTFRNAILYTSGGQDYVYLVNFQKYQKIRWVVASNLPAPPAPAGPVGPIKWGKKNRDSDHTAVDFGILPHSAEFCGSLPNSAACAPKSSECSESSVVRVGSVASVGAPHAVSISNKPKKQNHIGVTGPAEWPAPANTNLQRRIEADFPATTEAVRSFFPVADEIVLAKIVTESIKASPAASDDDIARAVYESYGPHYRGPVLFANTVPNHLRSTRDGTAAKPKTAAEVRDEQTKNELKKLQEMRANGRQRGGPDKLGTPDRKQSA